MCDYEYPDRAELYDPEEANMDRKVEQEWENLKTVTSASDPKVCAHSKRRARIGRLRTPPKHQHDTPFNPVFGEMFRSFLA